MSEHLEDGSVPERGTPPVFIDSAREKNAVGLFDLKEIFRDAPNVEVRRPEAMRSVFAAVEKSKLGKFFGEMRRESPEAFFHSCRMAGIAVDIGYETGLEGREIENLALAAVLHDIGKLRVPKEILDGSSPKLSEVSRKIVEMHPVYGLDMLQDDFALRDVANGEGVREITLLHHALKKRGAYPFNLLDPESLPHEFRGVKLRGMEEGIFRLLQIAAVADVFDALASERSYKKALGREEVERIMRDDVGVPEELIDAAISRYADAKMARGAAA